MAYREDRHNRIRDAYQQAFGLFSEREVTYKRVVNVVERRETLARLQYANHTQRYSGSRGYEDEDLRGYLSKATHPGSDGRRYYGESTHFNNIRRNTPPREEDSYPTYYRGTRDEGPIIRQVELRSSGRDGPHPSSGGQGFGPPLGRGEDHKDARWRETYSSTRDRSPTRRESQPRAPIQSEPTARTYSPDREKSYSYQQKQQRNNPKLPDPSVSLNKASLNGVPLKDDPPAPAEEPEEAGPVSEEVSEEVGEAVGEEPGPDLAPEGDFKTRRSRQIASKALEIEKLYRQDCNTFGTVVKMLVSKAPSLELLLQAPLDENLTEIKERCLEDLRHFISELDQATQPHQDQVTEPHQDQVTQPHQDQVTQPHQDQNQPSA